MLSILPTCYLGATGSASVNCKKLAVIKKSSQETGFMPFDDVMTFERRIQFLQVLILFKML